MKTNLYFRDAILAFKCMMGVASEYLGDKMHFLEVR